MSRIHVWNANYCRIGFIANLMGKDINEKINKQYVHSLNFSSS